MVEERLAFPVLPCEYRMDASIVTVVWDLAGYGAAVQEVGKSIVRPSPHPYST